VLQMLDEAAETVSELESCEGELVGNDRGQPAERDRQCVMVEKGDPEQRQAEQNKIDRNSIDDQGNLDVLGEGEAAPMDLR
jgi:hypothetical protein